MAPYAARTDPSVIAIEGKVAREAATLVLLYPIEGGETALVLTTLLGGLAIKQPEFAAGLGVLMKIPPREMFTAQSVMNPSTVR